MAAEGSCSHSPIAAATRAAASGNFSNVEVKKLWDRRHFFEVRKSVRAALTSSAVASAPAPPSAPAAAVMTRRRYWQLVAPALATGAMLLRLARRMHVWYASRSSSIGGSSSPLREKFRG